MALATAKPRPGAGKGLLEWKRLLMVPVGYNDYPGDKSDDKAQGHDLKDAS